MNADKYAVEDQRFFMKMLQSQIDRYRDYFTNIGRDDLLKEWIDLEKEDMANNVIMREQNSLDEMQKIGFKNSQIYNRTEMHAIFMATKR